MKRKKRWIVMMSLMVLISIWGVLTPESPELWMPDQYFNAANVAWMITATIFVLMMTPGLSFFYGVWWAVRMSFPPFCRALSPWE